MSVHLKFHGHSDHTFGEYEHFRDDYDNCASGKPIEWRLDAGAEAMVVRGQYVCGGVWMVGVRQVDEDTPLPTWPVRMASERYSAVLHIEAPDGVTMRRVRRLKPTTPTPEAQR